MADRCTRTTLDERSRRRAQRIPVVRMPWRGAAPALDRDGNGSAHRWACRSWLALFGMLCLLWASGADALSPERTLRELRHTGWGPKEGAPVSPTSMAQSIDGYLWLGSPSGLYRFDGLRFDQVDLPRDARISSWSVYSLYAPASGGLWIGFAFGGAALLKDGQMKAYGKEDGLPPGSVQAIEQQRDGTTWAGTSAGLARFDGSRWHPVGAESGYTIGATFILFVDSADTLWAASPDRVLFLDRGQTQFREARAQGRRFLSIGESGTGTVWLMSNDGTQRVQALRRNSNPDRQARSFPRNFLVDREGSVWLGSGNEGVSRFVHPETVAPAFLPGTERADDSFLPKDGLTGEGGGGGVWLEDREGNVWVVTEQGLDRFSEQNVNRGLPIRTGEPPLFSAFSSALAAGDDGALWFGGVNFPAFEVKGARVTVHDDLGPIDCIVRSTDGTMWLGGRKGLWHYVEGRFDRTDRPPSTLSVQALTTDRAGRLWASFMGREAVFRLEHGEWIEGGGIAALPKRTPVSLATDSKGRVWFGYLSGRVAMLDGDAVRVFADTEPLAVGNVSAIAGSGDTVWAGGEFGLARFDGVRFRPVLGDAPGLFDNITGIVATADGDVWVNSRAGIVHLSASQARQAADATSDRVTPELFGSLDGVLGNPARIRPLPTAVQGTDGRLWFTRGVDLFSIDPTRIARNRLPPPVLVQAVTVGDRAYPPTTDLTLPKRTDALRIDYVGLSLTLAEKVRYRYKLDGVDADWQDAAGRRQAFYTNLNPGPHHFHVMAANNDGVWNEAGATLDFVIPPTFVQTGWFVAICAICAIAVVTLAIRLRFRRLAGQMRLRFDERVAERERIARELHDTLLQGTQALVFKVQAAAQRARKGEPNHDMLEDALVHADEVITEGRDRIQDLRVPSDADADLGRSLAAVGAELARADVDFGVVVEGSTRALNEAVRDEAYRIGREALLNAFRHARATSIEVQIIYAEKDFRLRVRDDGIGIDAGQSRVGSRPGHWGLPGMRERARTVGAELEIWSRPGAGTEVELTIPAAAAFRQRPIRSRWLPLRILTGDGR